MKVNLVGNLIDGISASMRKEGIVFSAVEGGRLEVPNQGRSLIINFLPSSDACLSRWAMRLATCEAVCGLRMLLHIMTRNTVQLALRSAASCLMQKLYCYASVWR